MTFVMMRIVHSSVLQFTVESVRLGCHLIGVSLLCATLLSACASRPAEEARTPHVVHLEGKGPSTVIFESGLGDWSDSWIDIQPKVAAHCARTLAYNREGYPGSEVPTERRDARNIVDELRSELRLRGIDPPYVLVGHSLGGLYMQYFARNFPTEVKGLVLVDSTHWNERVQIDARSNGIYPQLTVITYGMPVIMRREFTDASIAGEQVHESPKPGYIPTVVLSSTVARRGESAQFRATAEELQDDIAAEYPLARHLRVAGSTHYIQRDRPEIVIEAVRELAGCSTAAPRVRQVSRIRR